MQLFRICAVAWDGSMSVPLAGRYGKDAFGRFVLQPDGTRYDLPDDCIVQRVPLVFPDAAPAATSTATPVEKTAPPPGSPEESDELKAQRERKSQVLAETRIAKPNGKAPRK